MNIAGVNTKVDITGQTFGRYKVLEYSHYKKNSTFWKCQCSCGNVRIVNGKSLRQGVSKSCGCYKSESTRKQRTIPHKIIDGVKCKKCCSCKHWVNINNFSVNSGHWDKLSSRCKDCDVKKRKSTGKNKKYFRDWANNKYATDINFRIKSAIQARIRAAIKNNYKAAGTTELVGCSIEYLKYYLEFQFKEGMGWDNYGEWHIDHKIPCAAFDLSDPEQQKTCFHYTNLQPLWWIDNIRKGAKIL